jgi:hypothetical protein
MPVIADFKIQVKAVSMVSDNSLFHIETTCFTLNGTSNNEMEQHVCVDKTGIVGYNKICAQEAAKASLFCLYLPGLRTRGDGK